MQTTIRKCAVDGCRNDAIYLIGLPPFGDEALDLTLCSAHVPLMERCDRCGQIIEVGTYRYGTYETMYYRTHDVHNTSIRDMVRKDVERFKQRRLDENGRQ